jgi:hypothetical protein
VVDEVPIRVREARATVSVARGTVLDVLNEICRAFGDVSWSVDYVQRTAYDESKITLWSIRGGRWAVAARARQRKR